MNLSYFIENDADVESYLQEQAAALIRKIGMEMYSQVTCRTPVDSGQARTNWFCSVNTMDLTVTDSVLLDPNRASEAFASVKAGDILYLCNSTPYILELENGSSTQAPAGMASITIQTCAAALMAGDLR